MFVTLQLCIISHSSILYFFYSVAQLCIFFTPNPTLNILPECVLMSLCQAPPVSFSWLALSARSLVRRKQGKSEEPHFSTFHHQLECSKSSWYEIVRRTLMNLHCPNPLNWWKWKLMTALIMRRVKVRQTVRFLLLQLMKVDWFKPTLMVIEQNTLLGTNYQVYWNAEAVGRSNSEEIIKEVNSLSRGEIL